jgi:hypothetical protein
VAPPITALTAVTSTYTPSYDVDEVPRDNVPPPSVPMSLPYSTLPLPATSTPWPVVPPAITLRRLLVMPPRVQALLQAIDTECEVLRCADPSEPSPIQLPLTTVPPAVDASAMPMPVLPAIRFRCAVLLPPTVTLVAATSMPLPPLPRVAVPEVSSPHPVALQHRRGGRTRQRQARLAETVDHQGRAR